MKKNNVKVRRKLGGLLISIATVCTLCSCGAKESQSDIEKSETVAEISTSEEYVDDKEDSNVQADTDVKNDIDDVAKDEKTNIEDASDVKDNSDNENVAYIDIIGIDKHFRNSKLGDKREEVAKAESEPIYTDFDLQDEYDGAIVLSAKNVTTTGGKGNIYYLFKDDVLFQGMIIFDADTKERILTKYYELQKGFVERYGEPMDQAENYGEDGAYVSVWENDGVQFGLTTMPKDDEKSVLCLLVTKDRE